MKKSSIAILVISGIFLVLLLVMSLTNIIRFYSISISSNIPGINPGDRILSSSLIQPKRFDFICFAVEKPDGVRETRVYRLCGIGGDQVEIRNGDLYVNGMPADQKFALTHEYNIPTTAYSRLEAADYFDESAMGMLSRDTLRISLPETEIRKNNIPARRVTLGKADKDETIASVYGESWNRDYFGPVTVPEGKYFLLGDNRHSCEDSRYLGFIDQSAFIGTVFSKR